MSRTILLTVLLTCAAAVLSLPLPSAAQQRSGATDTGFVWTGKIAPGAWLRIHNVKGSVQVTGSGGDVAEVRATTRRPARTAGDIAFEVLKDGPNVTICAIWRGESSCDADGITVDDGDGDSRRASANFTIRLPRGVRLHAGTGNGDVRVQNVGAEVVASSGNGEVRVSSAGGPVRASSGNGEVDVLEAGGPVSASTGNGDVRVSTAAGPVSVSSGNGDIDVRMRALRADDDMEFHTGNGTVTVTVPADFAGQLEANTGHGEVQSDFPLRVIGRLEPNRLRGTIGNGNRRIRMTSGNGDLELRKLE